MIQQKGKQLALKRSSVSSYSTYLLIKELEKRGMKVCTLIKGEKKGPFLVSEKGKESGILIGQKFGEMPHKTHYICSNKNITKHFLRKNRISVPNDVSIKLDAGKTIEKSLNNIKYPIVIKPVRGTWGKDVHCGVNKKNEALKIVRYFLNKNVDFMIEEMVAGAEYRILSSCESMLGVIKRVPANVVGDGVNDIKTLVKIKNKDPRRGVNHEKSLVKLKVDKEVIQYLKEQDISVDDIPPKGKIVYLRKNSNLSTGGDSYDCTDKAHPNYQILAPKVISSIPGLKYGGFDIITEDISLDPLKKGYCVLEVNDSPMISMHHEPYVGETRDVSKKIIDLFM